MRSSSLIILILASFISLTFPLRGQHNHIYRNHSLHQLFINPATAGSEFYPVAVVSFSRQWLGVNQSPTTLLASTSLRIGNFDFYNPKMFINTSNLKTYERIGTGLGVYSDHNGPIIQRGLTLAYSYHLSFSGSRLSLGLSGSAEQSVLDGSWWDPITPVDPLLSDSFEPYFHFNANMGAYYYTQAFYAGLSVTHLVPSEDKQQPGEAIRPDFFLHGGYLFRRLEELKIEPSLFLAFLDYDLFEYDIQAKLYIHHIHWVAVCYRSYKALDIMAGLKVRSFYIAYTFETNLSRIVKYNFGTHGLHLGLNLGVRRLEGF